MAERKQQRLFGVALGKIQERRLRVIGSIDVPSSEQLALGDTGKLTIEFEVRRGQVEVSESGQLTETVFVKPGTIALDGVIVVEHAPQDDD